MDEYISYASDDKSSVEAIERDFAMSSRRSIDRRSVAHHDRLLRADQIIPGLVIVVVAIILLNLFWPA